MSSFQTIIVLNGIVFPAGSARGIKEKLSLIDSGELKRDVNGNLHNLTRATHRKYTLSLDCQDMALPTLAETWRGTEIEVHCSTRLTQSTTSTTIELSRPPVAGSVEAINSATGENIAVDDVTDSTVTLDEFTGTAIVFYRPILQMMVSSRDFNFEEWTATQSWTLELEEA